MDAAAVAGLGEAAEIPAVLMVAIIELVVEGISRTVGEAQRVRNYEGYNVAVAGIGVAGATGVAETFGAVEITFIPSDDHVVALVGAYAGKG